MNQVLERRVEAPPVDVPSRRNVAGTFGRARGLFPVLLVVALWELLARVGFLPPVLVPAFSTTIAQWASLMASGSLPGDILISMFRALTGLGIAIVAGVVVGLAMARVRLVDWFFEPLVAIGFPMPTITLIPAFILWFGIGHESKILLIALTCFFPIALSTATGAREVNHYLIWSARAMGTSERQLFWRVILPAALPFIFSGIRVALPLSLIIDFVAEMIAGGGGLGYVLIYAYRFFQAPTVFAALITVMILGFLFDRALSYVRRRALAWHEEANAG